MTQECEGFTNYVSSVNPRVVMIVAARPRSTVVNENAAHRIDPATCHYHARDKSYYVHVC